MLEWLVETQDGRCEMASDNRPHNKENVRVGRPIADGLIDLSGAFGVAVAFFGAVSLAAWIRGVPFTPSDDVNSSKNEISFTAIKEICKAPVQDRQERWETYLQEKGFPSTNLHCPDLSPDNILNEGPAVPHPQ